jgi:hypothetical protein
VIGERSGSQQDDAIDTSTAVDGQRGRAGYAVEYVRVLRRGLGTRIGSSRN